MSMKKIFMIIGLILALALSACTVPTPVQPVPTATQQPAAAQPAANPPASNQAAAPNQPPAQSQPASSVRSIAVNGTGQVTLAPEMAYVYIGVHSQSEDVATALEDNNTKAQAVATALKGMGIDEKDIQTSSFTINPQTQYDPQGVATGKTLFSVDNTVYVTVRNLQTLGQVLDTAVRSGANSINGINFDVTDKTKTQAIADARKLAVDSAHAQAQALADDAGVGLSDLQTITASTTGNPVPMMDAKNTSFAASASQVPISAGQIVISVDVSITYAIK
jgi:uncharacterized protein YggE